MKLKIYKETLIDNFPEISENLITQLKNKNIKNFNRDDVDFFTVKTVLGIGLLGIEARFKDEVVTYQFEDSYEADEVSEHIECSTEDWLATLPAGTVTRTVTNEGDIISINSRNSTKKKFWE